MTSVKRTVGVSVSLMLLIAGCSRLPTEAEVFLKEAESAATLLDMGPSQVEWAAKEAKLKDLLTRIPKDAKCFHICERISLEAFLGGYQNNTRIWEFHKRSEAANLAHKSILDIPETVDYQRANVEIKETCKKIREEIEEARRQ